MKKYKLMQGIFGSILVLGGVTAIPITTSCSIKLNVTNFKGTVSAQYDVGSDDLSGTLSTDKYYVIGFTTTNDVKPSGNISLERSSGISKEGLQILTFNLINDKSDSFKPLKNLNGHIKNQGFSVQADERLTINVWLGCTKKQLFPANIDHWFEVANAKDFIWTHVSCIVNVIG